MNRTILAVILCAIVQLGILANTALPVVPNLLLLISIWVLLHGQPKHALWVALASGILLDAYASSAFGTYLMTFIIVILLLQWLVTSVLPKEENLMFVVIVVAAASTATLILSTLIDFGLAYATGKDTYIASAFFRLESLYSIFLNVVIYYPASYIFRKIIGLTDEEKSLRV